MVQWFFKSRFFCWVFFIPGLVFGVDWTSATQVGISAGVMAFGTALLCEGLSEIDYFHQRTEIEELDELTKRLKSRYHFLLSSNAFSVHDVASLLVLHVDGLADFKIKLHNDTKFLLKNLDAIAKRSELFGDFHDSVLPAVQLEEVLEIGTSLLDSMSYWDLYLSRHQSYFDLFWYLERVSLPLYDQYARYPSVSYVYDLIRDFDAIKNLYQSFEQSSDVVLYYSAGLIEKYQNRVSSLRYEIHRLVDSYAYQYEKESMYFDDQARGFGISSWDVNKVLIQLEEGFFRPFNKAI